MKKYLIHTIIILTCCFLMTACGMGTQLSPDEEPTGVTSGKESLDANPADTLTGEPTRIASGDEAGDVMESDEMEPNYQPKEQEESELPEIESLHMPTEWTMIHDTFDQVKAESHIGRKLGVFIEQGYNCNIDSALVIDSGQIMDGVVLRYEDREKFTVKIMNIADVSQAASECYVISVLFRAGEYAGEMNPGQYVLGMPVKNQIRQQFGVPNEEGDSYMVYDAVATEVSYFFWFSGLKQKYRLSERITCRLEFDQQTLTEIKFEDSKLTYREEEKEEVPTSQYEDMTPSVTEVLEPLE